MGLKRFITTGRWKQQPTPPAIKRAGEQIPYTFTGELPPVNIYPGFISREEYDKHQIKLAENPNVPGNSNTN